MSRTYERKPGKGESPWTPERTERLRALVAKGLSASKIGKELGVTRNAVVSKCHRIALQLKGPCPPSLEYRTNRVRFRPEPTPPRTIKAAVMHEPKGSPVQAVIRPNRVPFVPVPPKPPAPVTPESRAIASYFQTIDKSKQARG